MGQAQLKKRKENELKFEIKEEHFIQNGGILLEKQIALGQSQDIGPQQIKIFSAKDMEKATKCFDPDLIVGHVSTTVYKGTMDGKTVAIKAPVYLELGPLKPGPEVVNHFLTEASTGMVMNHNNLVKLYGCCLETSLPILVHEFLPNGSLFYRLHGDIVSRKSLTWANRLTIAADISYALSYMHTALPKPVVHRDVQSLSVLLDQSFHAKLSNLGFSVSINPGEKPQKWPVLGKPGYIDPEHIETQEVTEKCDVYSFGVLMLELLTGREPIMVARYGIDLVTAVSSAVENDHMMDMIEKDILEQGKSNEVERFAQLALKCVSKSGVNRPTMVEVVSELWQIQGQENKMN